MRKYIYKKLLTIHKQFNTNQRQTYKNYIDHTQIYTSQDIQDIK